MFVSDVALIPFTADGIVLCFFKSVRDGGERVLDVEVGD